MTQASCWSQAQAQSLSDSGSGPGHFTAACLALLVAGDLRPLRIAYGAAKFAPGGRGVIAAPTSQAYKACKQRYKQLVRLINEFRSSKIHWETNAILTSVVEIVSDNQVKILRGLQWLPKDAIGQSQLEVRHTQTLLSA